MLFDALKQPDGDMGMESPTCLAWKYEPLNEIDHIVIGKAQGPGGAWNDLDGIISFSIRNLLRLFLIPDFISR